MKKFLLLFTVLSSSLLVGAQPTLQDVAGVYELKLINTTEKIIIYRLNLDADGTFEFHSYDKVELGTSIKPRLTERNSYGKGSWTIDQKLVSFSSSSTDFNEKYTLNFNNSKARFISKHPRDKSDRLVETALRIYESEIFWIQSL